jgi:hypothetical protein
VCTTEESTPICDNNEADADEKGAHRADELPRKLTDTIGGGRQIWYRSQDANHELDALHQQEKCAEKNNI